MFCVLCVCVCVCVFCVLYGVFLYFFWAGVFSFFSLFLIFSFDFFSLVFLGMAWIGFGVLDLDRLGLEAIYPGMILHATIFSI